MIIQFSEAELNQLTIQPVKHLKRSAAYLEEREQVWAAQMERVLARGGHMWNGEIYTGEFSSLVAVTQQEAFDTTMQMTGAFRRVRPYLHLLPFILDGAQPVILQERRVS